MRDKLEVYYNKFNEDKRLGRRHGQVEYITAMKYIHTELENYPNAKIADIGAGTGRYSIPLFEEGYDVTAVEPFKCNLNVLSSKNPNVKAMIGNALDLKKLPDSTFDVVIFFGPMYHLGSFEEKVKALNEAKRICKNNGVIFVAYVMNEYGVISYAFNENQIDFCQENGMLDDNFHCVYTDKDLYSFVRLEDVDEINKACGLERIKIISADGPANYMRKTLNGLNPEQFDKFVEYHLKTCERPDLMGAGAHTIDILKVKK